MKICLVMIVKNESAVLRRCLESVQHFVDYVYIRDTGSTNKELEACADIIYETFNNQENLCYSQTYWIDFAHNRSFAMREAERMFPDADYLLMIDADDVLEPCERHDILSYDAYYVKIKHGNIEFPRLQLFKAGIGWRYRGVLHEFPYLPEDQPHTYGELPLVIRTGREGHRSSDPDKYLKDAAILEKALDNLSSNDEDLRPRYTFYLAQSYKDAGNYSMAAMMYNRRATMEGYQQEVYYSYYQAAKCSHTIGIRLITVIDLCEAASKVCPYRLEAAYFAAKLLRGEERFKKAAAICEAHPNRTVWADTLFAEPEIYKWMMDDEASISNYYAGNHMRSLKYAVDALGGIASQEGNPNIRRLITNLLFSYSKAFNNE